MAGKVKKHQIALFLNFGTAQAPKYVRIKKSTELTLNFDPQTEDYDYIADESPTTDLERYAPKIEGLPLTMYKGEPDFDALWEYAYNLKTGGDSTTSSVPSTAFSCFITTAQPALHAFHVPVTFASSSNL